MHSLSQRHRNGKTYRNERGATMVEILLTIALLALISTVFLQMLTQSIEMRLVGAEYTQANKLANAYAETIKTYTTAPSGGAETLTNYKNSKYTVKATWTNESGIVQTGTVNPINQMPTDTLPQPHFTLDLSATEMKVAPQAGITVNYNISSLTNNTLTWAHDKVDATNNASLLKFYHPSEVLKPLGNTTGQTVMRINVKPNLTQIITLRVENTSPAELMVQVYDDTNSRIQIDDQTVLGQLNVKTGLLTTTDTGVSTSKYYTVKIEILNANKRVTELISSVTLE